jgi:16S rRNA U1498 N3-methylase RsmE
MNLLNLFIWVKEFLVKKKMDFTLEKAVELGASTIIH